MENANYHIIGFYMGLYRGYIGVILGLYTNYWKIKWKLPYYRVIWGLYRGYMGVIS